MELKRLVPDTPDINEKLADIYISITFNAQRKIHSMERERERENGTYRIWMKHITKDL